MSNIETTNVELHAGTKPCMNSYLLAGKYEFMHGFVPACSSRLVVSTVECKKKLPFRIHSTIVECIIVFISTQGLQT